MTEAAQAAPADAPAASPARGYPCPICQTREIETVITQPAIRGFLLAYQISTRRVLACRSCARKSLLGEAGKSMLIGWFSPTSLVVNPVFILWNAGRAPFVGANPEKVAKVYRELGVPVPGESIELPLILYSLAVNMIAADGKFEDAEVETAARVGRDILPEFDDAAFQEVLGRWARLPEPEQNARLMGNVLSDGGRRLINRYLYEIAAADGHIDRKEKRLLKRVSDALFQANMSFEDYERMAQADRPAAAA